MKLNCITIVTPSFNQGKYIEQTITSVLSQQGNFYLDYIIADGGSTDDSLAIIKKYANLLKTKKYPVKCRRISYRFWSKRDRGQTYALNKAFKQADGEICAWLNADDWLEEAALSTVVSYFNTRDADLIYGGCNFIKDEDKKRRIIRKSIPFPVFDYDRLLNDGNFIPNPATFLKKSLLGKAGFIDHSYPLAFDYDLWLRCARLGRFFPCKKILANYRIHPEAKTEKLKLRSFYEQKEIARKFGGKFFSPVHYLYWGEWFSQNCKILSPAVKLAKLIYRSISSYK